MAGNRSLFQDTVERVEPLKGAAGELIIVGSQAHHRTILEQLGEIGQEGVLLLEPEGRDSAAAMAVAALWTARRDPTAVNVFVASDHHIPDGPAFREAVSTAAAAAEKGRIVTLGVKPTQPSTAYGYISPAHSGLAEVKAFIEKPDKATAERYIAAGYLWNSGNFIVRADVLTDEIAQTTVGLIEGVTRAMDNGLTDGAALFLGTAFASAPKISIDYAVMEKTRRASVLPVDFVWSDLGAWDAVHASGEGSVGLHVFEDVENCLVRACDGVMVATIGVSDIAVIVERDAVLVTDLRRSQDVKKVVNRLKTLSPRHLDFPFREEESLVDGASRLAAWIRQSALPIWCTLGQNDQGGFEELLGHDGRRLDSALRARVQASQIHVYAQAARLGWSGPWRAVLKNGLAWLHDRFVNDDGAVREHLTATGAQLDGVESVHDQSFFMLAHASVQQIAPDMALEQQAVLVRDRLLARWHVESGLAGAGSCHQSSAQIRLLEAAMAWEEAGGDGNWALLADRIVSFACMHFLDAETGALNEFLTPDSRFEESSVEPGHQFEWAWLLARQAQARENSALLDKAWRLFEGGLRGVDLKRDVIVDALDVEGRVRSARARLQSQAGWLKAALALASIDHGRRDLCLNQAAHAQRAVWRYLTPNGLWRDKMLENGSFIDEPAPASSFYHVMTAFTQTKASMEMLKPDMAERLALG